MRREITSFWKNKQTKKRDTLLTMLKIFEKHSGSSGGLFGIIKVQTKGVNLVSDLFKGRGRYFPDLAREKRFRALFFWKTISPRIRKLQIWFFHQKKSKKTYFLNPKVFFPTQKVFLPPLSEVFRIFCEYFLWCE